MEHDDHITHTFGWQIDKGKLRKRNEDSLGATKIKLITEDTERSVGIYMVADGIGGMPGGQEASKLAIQTAMREMITAINQHDKPGDIAQWLQDAARVAHRSISLQQSRENTVGTTLVMAAVIENNIYIVNIGDSRAYLVHDGQLRQITRDHTVAQVFVEAGVISQEEVNSHPYRNVLSQAIGLHHIDCDSYGETADIGDYLLLCSDGLSSYVSADEILRIIVSSESPQQACDTLTKAANDTGGRDNIAVIVVELCERNK